MRTQTNLATLSNATHSNAVKADSFAKLRSVDSSLFEDEMVELEVKWKDLLLLKQILHTSN